MSPGAAIAIGITGIGATTGKPAEAPCRYAVIMVVCVCRICCMSCWNCSITASLAVDVGAAMGAGAGSGAGDGAAFGGNSVPAEIKSAWAWAATTATAPLAMVLPSATTAASTASSVAVHGEPDTAAPTIVSAML